MAGELDQGSPDLNAYWAPPPNLTDSFLPILGYGADEKLRDMNLPKFVFEDSPSFWRGLGTSFPGGGHYPRFNDVMEGVLSTSPTIE